MSVMHTQQANLAALSRPQAMPVPRPPRRWGLRVGLPVAIIATAGGLLAYSARRVLTPAIDVSVAPAVPVCSGGEQTVDGDSAAPAAVAWVQAPGWVEPSPYAVHVPALVEGVVSEVLVLEGQRVRAGEVVVTLVDTDARLAVRRAEAARQAAEAAVAEAESNHAAAQARAREVLDELERKRALSSSGAVAAGELSRLELRHAAAEREAAAIAAGVESARALLASHQVEYDAAALALERTRIVSPCDGVVLSRLVEPGQRLSMGSGSGPMGSREAGVLRLYDPARLQVRVDVPMAEAGRVAIGDAAEITTEAAPNRTFAGRVARAVHEANIQRNTVQFKVEVDAASLGEGEGGEVLKPEMLCRVRLATRSGVGHVARLPSGSDGAGEAASVSVPVSALVDRRDGRARVWVVITDPRGGSRVEAREVRLGEESAEGEIELTEGLRPGDRVVVEPPSGLRDRSPVRVREAQP
jgi:RND family efflux transporter MFP subunit